MIIDGFRLSGGGEEFSDSVHDVMSRSEPKKQPPKVVTMSDKSKIIVTSHGDNFIDPSVKACVCPECGTTEVQALHTKEREQVHEHSWFDKITYEKNYECTHCGCEFKTSRQKTKFHRITGEAANHLEIFWWVCIWTWIVLFGIIGFINAMDPMNDSLRIWLILGIVLIPTLLIRFLWKKNKK